MKTEGKVLAIIPARAGSKGLPRKNVLKLGGKCLFQWPLDAALGVIDIDTVVVSSDDAEIEEIVINNYDERFVVFDKRPASLCGDTVPSSDVVIHVLSRYASKGYSVFVLLEPTSPLTTSNDIQESLDLLKSARAAADALVGVGRVESAHPAFVYSRDSSSVLIPLSSDKSGYSQGVLRRQDLTDLYYLDGSIYISDVQSYLQNRSFLTSRTLGKLFSKHKNIEIDDITDYQILSALVATYSVEGHLMTNKTVDNNHE